MKIPKVQTHLLFFSVISLAAIGMLSFNTIGSQSPVSAADVSKFDPGNIMSDSVMSNKNSMSVSQIQSFLNSKNSCNNRNIHMATWYPHLQYSIRDGKFLCLSNDTFGGKSAAQIIWQVAQDYSINPQFLIVLLEKEQGLVSDTWPNNVQYRTATGFGCPDTAPCDAQYYGLENQLRHAASLFRTVLNGGWSNYPVGHTYVQYHPNAACGGSVINIQNRATSALYRYTPYQPNRSALNAGYGQGDTCGAYGNRNTWMLFTDWFGSTQHHGSSEILNKYNSMGGVNSWLGRATGSVGSSGKDGFYQSYEGGKIYWHPRTGAKTVRYGAVNNHYATIGYEGGYLGYPTTDEVTIPGKGIYQVFEGGQLYWSPETGAWSIRRGAMFNRYAEIGYESSYLGFPVSGELRAKDGTYQQFQGGRLYWRPGVSSSMDMSNEIVTSYRAAGGETGYLGLPTRAMICGLVNKGCWIMFDKGKIYSSPQTGTYDIYGGAIDSKYAELGWEAGKLGYPTSREIPTGKTCKNHRDVKQNFQGGAIHWSACSTPNTTVEYK